MTVTVLSFWDALSDERTDLSLVYATDSRQRSLSRVRVPWDWWPYFTVSDLRLPFSSPTTRRITVEVLEPASTPVALESEPESESYVTTTVSRTVYLGIKHLSGAYDQIFITFHMEVSDPSSTLSSFVLTVKRTPGSTVLLLRCTDLFPLILFC
jgi:hypothetical protein